MQQICSVFYRCEDCACMLHIISLRAQISQSVKYWYEICYVLVPYFTCYEELVPIFHSVKFVKCEICSATKRSMAKILFSRHMADPVNADPILMRFCADI